MFIDYDRYHDVAYEHGHDDFHDRDHDDGHHDAYFHDHDDDGDNDDENWETIYH